MTDVEVEKPSGTRRSTWRRSARSCVTRQLPPLPAALPDPTLTVHLDFQLPALMPRTHVAYRAASRPRAGVGGHAGPAGRRSRPPPAQPQQPQSRSALTISGEPGAPPRFAVPDFVALSSDAETAAAAKMIGQVLWDDLDFEREFDLIPRDTYAVDPAGAVARRRAVRPLARAGRRRRHHRNGAEDRRRHPVEVRLYQRAHAAVASSPRSTAGSAANPRLYAHTIADEIHQQQRALRGVARTKLAFDVRSRRRAGGGHGREPRASRRSTSPTTTARTSGG